MIYEVKVKNSRRSQFIRTSRDRVHYVAAQVAGFTVVGKRVDGSEIRQPNSYTIAATYKESALRRLARQSTGLVFGSSVGAAHARKILDQVRDA